MSRSRRHLLPRYRPIAIAFGLVCVLLASSPPVEAQTSDGAPLEASGLTLRDLNRISVEIEELEGSLDDQPRLEGLRSRLAEIEDWYARQIEGGLVATRVSAMDRARIEELLLVLTRRRTEVAELGRDLDRAIEEVEAIHAAILSRSEAWSQARADFAAEMPDEVAELVGALDDKVATARGKASRRLGELVALQGEVLDASGRIEDLLASAKERRREIHADVLRRDERPIWALPAATDALPVRVNLEAAGQNVVRAFGDLEEAYADRLVLHGVLAILLLALVVGLRRSSSLRQHTEFAAAQRALARPLPLTAVLTLALTQPLYPTAQPAVVTVNTVLFIAVELIVLHAVTRRLSAGSLWWIGSFLILARLSDLLPFASVSHRVAVLLIGVGGIALMIAARRLLRSTADFRVWRWRRVTEASMVLATAILAVAVMGNAVGAFGLAVYLTQGIIRSLLSGLGLITLAILLRDLSGLGLVVGPLKRLRSIRLHAATVRLRLRSLIAGVGIVFWLWATLAAFGGLDAVVAAIGWVLTASIQVGETSITPGTILIFGIALWIAVCVSRVTRFFLDEDVLPRLSLPRGVPGAISAGLHYVLIAVAIVIGTQAAGFDLTKVTIVFGALGVGIGFGLQNIVNNFMSGLILLFERPIQLGDNVQVGALMGTVRKIGIRASIVRTYEGSEVIVPNGDLISQQVVNFTLSDRSRRLEFLVGIAYGSDLEHAREVIADAVAGVDRVVSTPAPQVFFEGFGESSLDFRVLFWVGDFDDGLATRSQVGLAIERALRDAGFKIPFPQQDVHLSTSRDSEDES